MVKHSRKPAVYMEGSVNAIRKRASITIKSGEEIASSVPYFRIIVALLLINLIFILFVLFYKHILPPEIPLFYGLPESNEQLAPSSWLIIPGMLSMIITIINTSFSFLAREGFLKSAFSIASIVVGIFSILATLEIIFLVGYI